MTLILFAIIVLIIVGMLIYAVDYLGLGNPFNGLLKVLIILLGVILIANRAGLL